jgi:DNA-binding Lrp family transcriptional regulator
MPTAFVFIRVRLGTAEIVYGALAQLPSVQEVHMIYGKHDILAKITSTTMTDLKHVITHTIRQLGNVLATQTMVVIDS